MEIKYADGFKDSCDKLFSNKFKYKLLRGWRWFLRIPREIKWFSQKRIKGYSDQDLWNLYYPLGKHIVKCLKAFKKINRQGYPGYAKTSKKWEKILDDMIYGWETLTNWDDIEGNILEKYEDIWKEDELFGRCKSWSDKNFKKGRRECDKVYKNAQDKAKLFIEYFHCLWD